MLKRMIPAMTILLVSLMTTTALAEEPRLVVSGEGSDQTIAITDVTPADGAEPSKNKNYMVGDYYPIEVRTAMDGNAQLVIKTFLVPPDVPASALIEDNLVRRGVEYEVSDVLRREVAGITESKTISQTLSAPVEKNNESEALAALTPSVAFNKDGYTGTLLLDSSTISIRESGSENYTYTLKDIREYNSLERNDPYYVPKTAEKNGVTLSLADIQWTPMGTGGENSDDPGLYRAVVTYTGRAAGSKASGYIATATYSGKVTSMSEGSVLFSIVYEAAPNTKIKVKSNFDFAPLFFGIGTLFLIAIVAVLILYFIRRGKLAVESGVTDPACQDPFAGRPAMDLPQMLDDMDRGIDGGDEK
ncbi:hypothetical protein [Anaerotruncus rubiinfantis]|uniref:hypothetical protein n=1 Tax=Anaerotruncus rubiinfantis TaxID=1720200 RepID=UPI00082E7FA0|nr:hypothetical protein [Anaerotruncus rubiinfantis]